MVACIKIDHEEIKSKVSKEIKKDQKDFSLVVSRAFFIYGVKERLVNKENNNVAFLKVRSIFRR